MPMRYSFFRSGRKPAIPQTRSIGILRSCDRDGHKKHLHKVLFYVFDFFLITINRLRTVLRLLARIRSAHYARHGLHTTFALG